MVTNIMKTKIRDNRVRGDNLRTMRNKVRRKIEDKLGPRTRKCRWIMKSVKENNLRLRTKLRKKNGKKFEFLVKKYGVKTSMLDELNEEDRSKYGEAEIFCEDYKVGNEEKYEPIVICENEEVIKLNKDEVELLRLGPKFCVLNDLCGEKFEKEIEECIVKLRWEVMAEDRKKKEDREIWTRHTRLHKQSI